MTESLVGSEVLAAGAPGGVWGRGAIRLPRAVEKYGIGRTVLYGLLNRGVIPFARVPGGRLIPIAAIEAWLAAQTTGGDWPATAQKRHAT